MVLPPCMMNETREEHKARCDRYIASRTPEGAEAWNTAINAVLVNLTGPLHTLARNRVRRLLIKN